ncbi:MAG: alpha/beta hydrolase [Gemmatimonadota bacterium]
MRHASLLYLIPLLPLLLLAATCDLPLGPKVETLLADLRGRAGTLAEVEELPPVELGATYLQEVCLRSSSGLTVAARIRVPRDAGAGDRRAGAVLVGGVQTDWGVTELLPDSTGQVLIAMQYPEPFRQAAEGVWKGTATTFQRAAWDVPAMLLVLADYLATRPEVDPRRIVLIGVSFGGFFAPAAAAADTGFVNVALMYTGADLRGVAAELAASYVEELPEAFVVLASDVATLPLARLEPRLYVGRISPRPVLLVNGLADERVPRNSALALHRAAREPKDILWLPTGHLEPGDTALIVELVDTAFARLPIFRDP